MNSKPLPKIQSFLKELKRKNSAESNGKKQTFQEFHAAGGGVPTQYKGREHVWHAKVDKFAAGGAVQPAALIDGNDFVKAAQANGLKTDNATLNKIVARVNRGESVQEAAKNVAQSRAAGGEVKMAGGGDPRGEMKAYDPTIRERMADALQRGIEGLGGSRYKSRQNAQTLMGGPSSNLPINLGIADFVPFLGTGLGVDEGARDLGHAYDAVKRGDYVDAAANTVGAAAGLIPGAAGTIRGAKAAGRKALAAGRASERLADRAVPKIMERGGMGAEMLQGMSRGTVSPMDVYHGSPHKFDKFDASKIGTGEGAQAYGHGLYFAENPAVAQTYLAGSAPTVRQQVMPDGRIKIVDVPHNPGALYKVDLPDEQIAKMLDYDKPLSEQQNILSALTPESMGLTLRQSSDGGFMAYVGSNGKPIGMQMKGATPEKFRENWINRLKEMGDLEGGAGRAVGYLGGTSNSGNLAPSVSEALRQAGIPGIKYLDATSRGAGKGTRNFVTFPGEEKSLTILERNGQPMSVPAAPEGMAGGGAPKQIVEAGIKGVKKLLGVADEVPKGVEPIVVRTPEERAVMEKFGQKQEQEAARKKKVEKADKAAKENAGNAPEESGKPPKSTGKRVAVTPDYYRKMANDLGDEAVLRSARAGKHLKPTDAGYIGAPRTVTSPQGLGAMRKGMDTDFADAVEAVRLADPERLGTWYDRAKQGIAESTEPYQLPRSLEQHAVYSAGVSPESELTFALKHLNSRVAGEPGMAYRGAGMRNLDEAVAESRPANLGFKIGEYGEKNDPRVPNTGLFGVNDFRRAQGMGYTDPQGNPWKAGVSDTMHPFMDAETALQVDRANTAGTGGRSDWQGPHIQEVPWVYGKGQDLHGRGLKGRYAGDELEGIKMALRDANNTARDYFYKHTGSATHEAIPGASTGHVPQMIDAPYEQKVAYGNTGRWDMPAPEYALSDMGTVGAGNRDAIYSALGYRQLPTLEASGAYFPEGAKIAEHQPVKIARPLLDFPTGGGGLVAEPTRHTMEFGERFRALNDAQEAFGFNLPNTMADVKGKNSLVLDTRGANPKYLDEPHTGVMPNETQMGALTQALGDVGYGVAPTSRGATVFPFDPKATAADARKLMKEKGSELQKIYPSEMEPSLNTSGYGPGVGVYTPEGFRASEPFSGQATMGLLKEASYLPPEVALNLGESENVRSAIRAKMNRDAALPNARADIQETRRFFSDADWPKAVELIRQGYTPAAALAALGYSASSMAEDRR
jgi:hypothetical protein